MPDRSGDVEFLATLCVVAMLVIYGLGAAVTYAFIRRCCESWVYRQLGGRSPQDAAAGAALLWPCAVTVGLVWAVSRPFILLARTLAGERRGAREDG